MFNQSNSGYSLADIAAATGGRDGEGWGGSGAWWIIILFLFVFCGWGNGGWGGNGGGSAAAVQPALTRGELCMDMNFQDLKNAAMNGLDATNLGFSNLNATICHQQYDTAQMMNGINVGMLQGFNAANVVALQNQNALQTQLAQCCCENREGQAQINYNMATQACDTRNTIQNAARDIVDNQNAGVRAILEKLTQQELAAKDAQIAAQGQKIFGLELAASQAAQNNYLVSTLAPKAVPSYPVPNPYTGMFGFGLNGVSALSCGGCCGCNC